MTMTTGTAFLRGQLAYAQGKPCVLKHDATMVAALHDLDNRTFSELHQMFIQGWNEAKEIATEMRAPSL